MTESDDGRSAAENARLVAELEEAEAYEQQLRQLIVDVRDVLAAGNSAEALSLLNEALRNIDNAADVVAPIRGAPPQ